MINRLVFYILSIAFGISAHAAEKMDIKTHDSLISKLESVVANDKTDSMLQQSQLFYRLADLYSERSRLLSLESEGRGEQLNKKQINSDRKKAITIYKKILSTLKDDQKNHALLQTAHLYNLTSEPEQAIKIYNNIVRHPKSVDELTLAQAMVQLGDIWFYRGEYAASEKILKESLALKANPRKSYAAYRIAWCSYNSGRTELAKDQLILLLSSPHLFVTRAGEIDNSFKEEVSRDLATFLSSNDVSEADIESLFKLSPEGARQKNLIYLATELDRTGKKKSAIAVWKRVGKQNLTFEDQLEGQIRITKIQYDLGLKPQLLHEINNSLLLLKNSACPKNPECAIGQQNLRKILTDWGNAERRIPSSELILGFQKYNDAFKDDEMSSWAGHAALKKKMYSSAFQLFKSSATIISEDREKLKTPKGQRILEGSLLGAIEAAESLNQTEPKLEAYNLYLNLNSRGAKRFEVRYQIAQTYYSANQHEKASNLFYELAKDSEAPASLREKSSELCLDALVLLKREDDIEKISAQFAEIFKSRQNYFSNINRKSILNQSAKVINNKEEKNGELESQWRKLNSLATDSWPFEQKKVLLKNKLALALKLKNAEMISVAADDIAREKRFTQAEINSALTQKAWVYEMKMDFNTALTVLKQVKPSRAELPEYYFKLALLSELMKKNPSAYYQEFLAVSKSISKRQYAIHQLILFSNDPHKAFIKQGAQLKTNQGLYLSAGLLAYEKSRDFSLARRIIANTRNNRSFELALLSRSLEISDFTQQLLSIKKVHVNTSNEKTLQRNLALKIKLLTALDKRAQKYIQRKDNTLQLVALAHVSNENRIIAQDILALPTPKKLNASQKKFYQDQIQQKVRPFLAKSESVRLRAVQLLQDSIAQSLFKDIYELSVQTDKPGSRLAWLELEHLRRSAGLLGFTDDPFINFTRERHKVASEAEKLQQRVIDNPFSSKDLEDFMSAQKALGSGAFVAYLEQRLNVVKRGTN
ncbi:MAG: hypothetical protein AABY64_03175 [Bdellovibrionota bacterium]